MDFVEQNLMTAQEFERKTKEWSIGVRSVSKNILNTKTHASGELAKTLNFRLRYEKEKLWVDAIGFHFNRYGAFREYGAGRGYVVNNGVITRGQRLWNIRKEEFINDELAASLRSRGYTTRELKNYKLNNGRFNIRRHPLSWFDKPIADNLKALGDIAGEFYGDQALKDVLNQINRLTIKKNYGEIQQ